MSVEWIAAGAGLIGALGAVLIQSVLTHFGTTAQRNRELLLETYNALIATTAALKARDDEVRNAAFERLIAAKQRILYFAPTEVVHALAEFSRTSQVLGQPDADLAFVSMLKAMRQSLALPPVDERDLLRILIGKDQVTL